MKLTPAISKLYSNCVFKLKFDDEKCGINYGTGVQHGDNMAPILFLFIMQAFVKILEPLI